MSDNSPQLILEKINSLLLYQSVFASEIGAAFIELLQTLALQQKKAKFVSSSNCTKAYGKWFKKIAAQNESWQDYLVKEILQNDNPFSQQAQIKELKNIPKPIVNAAERDLKTLESIYNCSEGNTIAKWLENIAKPAVKPVSWDLENCQDLFLNQTKKWASAIADLADYYRANGTGIFAKYRAFRWLEGTLQGIDRPDPIEIDTLAGYESQKATIIKNTEFLLAGWPALHVLLYGSRGSGKSSLVKSLLQKYSDRGLRLVEVSKLELHNLLEIVAKLRSLPQKFIIFVDDLSFAEEDDRFLALKVVLEGSLTAKPSNIVVYATSNRRHLVREFFADRPAPQEADEIHSWDTMQEKLSFSDRFGITLTFPPADLETYFKIVTHLAAQQGIKIEPEQLLSRAKQWAIRHNGRSGRSARQFIDFLRAELAENFN